MVLFSFQRTIPVLWRRVPHSWRRKRGAVRGTGMSSTPRLQDQFTLLLVRLCCSLYSSFLNQSLLLYQLLSYLNFNGLYFKPPIIFKFANLICNIPLILIIFSYLHFNPHLYHGWGARPYKAPFEREGFIYHYRLEVFWNSLQVIFEW